MGKNEIVFWKKLKFYEALDIRMFWGLSESFIKIQI